MNKYELEAAREEERRLRAQLAARERELAEARKECSKCHDEGRYPSPGSFTLARTWCDCYIGQLLRSEVEMERAELSQCNRELHEARARIRELESLLYETS